MNFWKILPVCLLTACASTSETGGGTDSPADFRVVATRNLPLAPPSSLGQGQRVRVYGSRNNGGNLTEEGFWSITKKVAHTRLLCATYETGVQFGRGDAACSNVNWLTDVDYVTRHKQCNSATMIHSGSGAVGDRKRVFDQSNCVRMVTRCRGRC